MSKIWIVSLVMVKVSPSLKNRAAPDLSIQNEVGICRAETSDEAFHKVGTRARLKFADHKIAVRVVIEANEIDLGLTEEYEG